MDKPGPGHFYPDQIGLRSLPPPGHGYDNPPPVISQPGLGYAPSRQGQGYAQGNGGPGYYAQPPFPQQQTANNTTVVMVQQPAAVATRPQLRDWSTGTCGCFEDMEVCCCVLWCPLCYGIKMTMDMDESCCTVWCVPYWLTALRIKLRTQENIRGSILSDHISTTICCCLPSLAMCQLAREIKLVKSARG